MIGFHHAGVLGNTAAWVWTSKKLCMIKYDKSLETTSCHWKKRTEGILHVLDVYMIIFKGFLC